MCRFAVALLLPLLVPGLARAQDAKKFNAKELEAEFAPLAVFQQKGAVVDNEVIITREPERALVQAVYVVKSDLKKVLDFYGAKLSAAPQKQGDEELGTVKYLFAPTPRQGDARLYRVAIEPTENRAVQVTLTCRAVTEDDEVIELDDPPPASQPAVDEQVR